MPVLPADEYVHTPSGQLWPDVFKTCMFHSRIPTGMYTLRRSEVMTSRMHPKNESRLWATPAESLAQHPLTYYDRMAPKSLRDTHSKNIVSPATEVIAYFVHEGKVLHGQQRYMNQSHCVQLLHVANFHGMRVLSHVDLNESVPLVNWVLQPPQGQAVARR